MAVCFAYKGFKAHRDAVKLAKTLHRDISLLNLLFVLDTGRDLVDDLLKNLPQDDESSKYGNTLQGLVDKWRPRRGLLVDWAYAIPTPDHPDFFPPSNVSPSPTHDLERSQTSSVLPPLQSQASLSDSVPVNRAHNGVEYVSWNDLRSTDDIVVPMANDPLPRSSSVPSDQLYRTVRLFIFVCVPVLMYTRERGPGWPQNLVV